MEYVILALIAVSIALNIVLLIRQSKKAGDSEYDLKLETAIKTIAGAQQQMRGEIISEIAHSSQLSAAHAEASKSAVFERLSAAERLIQQNDAAIKEMLELHNRRNTDAVLANNRAVDERLGQLQNQFATMTSDMEQRLNQIRTMVSGQLADIRSDNSKQLDEMRRTVDEKLQNTLDERLTKSFGLVSERLEQVNKGLGEMQTLAADVGSLKRVMTGVKTRGNLGEVQLGAIIEDMLSPEQFERNFAVKAPNRVEFAIKLPGDDETVYLPVDSKFPMEAYERLLIASETSDKLTIASASKALSDSIKSFAKDVSSKYILPPKTTDFAIIFLPSEGLYAEAVRLGLLDILRRDYNVTLTGPSTMGALLNSLQIGFRSYIVHKRSGEVWRVLQDVKKEFSTFATVLEATQDKLTRASDDLDKLVGTRTRAMNRKLRSLGDSAETTLFIEGETASDDKH